MLKEAVDVVELDPPLVKVTRTLSSDVKSEGAVPEMIYVEESNEIHEDALLGLYDAEMLRSFESEM